MERGADILKLLLQLLPPHRLRGSGECRLDLLGEAQVVGGMRTLAALQFSVCGEGLQPVLANHF